MGDVTSIPKNPIGSKPAKEIRKRKMPIKREETATETGLEDLKRENHREEEKREGELKRLSGDTLYFCFLTYPLHLEKAVYVC